MTLMYANSKIYPGYNNAGSLVAWESITPTGDTKKMFAPVVFGGHNPGPRFIRGNGLVFFNGADSMDASFGALTQWGLYYIQTWLCNGGYSGLVTVEFRMLNPDAYVQANAVLDLTNESENKKVGLGWESYKLKYRKIEIL